MADFIHVDVKLVGDNDKDFRRIISAFAFGVEARIKLGGTEAKHGLEYRRPGGRTHTASAPGESPAIDTGFLHNSIQVNIKSDIEGEIIIPAEYAEALEFGTGDIAARPFVQPAIDSALKELASGGILAGLRG